MSTDKQTIPKVKLAEIYKEVLDGDDEKLVSKIIKKIENTSWPDDEKEKVIGALGLKGFRSKKPQDYIDSFIPIFINTLILLILLQGIREIYIGNGPITSLLYKPDLALQQISPFFYEMLKVLFSYAGSFVKSPAKFEHNLLLNALITIDAIILVGAGLKNVMEKFEISNLMPRSIIERDRMIELGTWPIDEIGHILAFGVTDSSIAEPLMSILKKYGQVVPVHRGSTNTYPLANKRSLWVCAGADKTSKVTREMASRELLLRANCLDASVVVVNCMREISVYRPLDLSEANIPTGVLFPQTADAIVEETAELDRLLGESNQCDNLFIAIVSRFTMVGDRILDTGSIPATSLFIEERDVPSVVIEPEALVETRLRRIIHNLKEKDGLFKNEISVYILFSGAESTDSQAAQNMENSLLTNGLADKIANSPEDSNIVILASVEDQCMTVLAELYRDELDSNGMKDIPIVVVQKRPDKRALTNLGHIYTIAVQDLIAQKVDKVLEGTMAIDGVTTNIKNEGYHRLRKRSKERLAFAKIK